ncbi:hypothetical protein KQR54_29420 [Mycobacterium gordonae]|uniref:hypothetical protein n=1 Tax=Mycobacterium gordonae TaxID=1778 RepID=UPI00210C63C7|nr:hypothetical protein [Mycobacterium gordonae]MCQ4365193.1 hypothetical protein [Mycobacterium gordonae]
MSGHAWMETILLLGVLAVGAVIFYCGHSDFASKRNTRIRKVRAQLHRTPGVHLGPEGTVPFDSLNLPCSWVFQEVRHQVSHLFPRHPDFSKRVLIFGDPQAMQHLFARRRGSCSLALPEHMHRGLGRSDGGLRGAEKGQPAKHSGISQ